MALDYDKVTAHIRHTLGGDVSAETDVYDIINNAGDFMASLYPWRWLEHTQTLTDSSSPVGARIADHAQSVDLSGLDFVELISFGPRGLDSRATTANGVWYAVSLQEIIDKREVAGTGIHADAYTSVPDGAFYFAVAWYSNEGTAVPIPQLEIFPTVDDSVTEFNTAKAEITITYRKGWGNISTPSSTFVMPTWCEPLYLQCVRGFARGYEEEDVGTTNARLSDVMQGPLVLSAIQRDSLIEATTQRTIRRATPSSLAGLAGNNALVN